MRKEPKSGLELTNREIVTRAEIKSQVLDRLSHPGALGPVLSLFKKNFFNVLFIFERERESTSKGGQKERETQAPGSEISVALNVAVETEPRAGTWPRAWVSQGVSLVIGPPTREGPYCPKPETLASGTSGFCELPVMF